MCSFPRFLNVSALSSSSRSLCSCALVRLGMVKHSSPYRQTCSSLRPARSTSYSWACLRRFGSASTCETGRSRLPKLRLFFIRKVFMFVRSSRSRFVAGFILFKPSTERSMSKPWIEKRAHLCDRLPVCEEVASSQVSKKTPFCVFTRLLPPIRFTDKK